jgi:hypothetical protein
MTRQQSIETLRLAWQMAIPDTPAPNDNFLGIWAHHCGDELGLAIEAIEVTAARHKRQPLENAYAFCWALTKNRIHKYLDTKQEQQIS